MSKGFSTYFWMTKVEHLMMSGTLSKFVKFLRSWSSLESLESLLPPGTFYGDRTTACWVIEVGEQT
jgi:hypothetical protein